MGTRDLVCDDPRMKPISSPQTEPRKFLRALYDTAVQRALPAHSIAAHLPKPPKGRTLVLGAGKAGGAMAEAVDAMWPQDAPLSGLVVTRYDHVPPAYRTLQQQGRAREARVERAHAAPPSVRNQGMQRRPIHLIAKLEPMPSTPMLIIPSTMCG